MRNLRALALLTTLAALAHGPAHAACTFPPPPHKIPDGATATAEQMKDGQKTVDDYATAVNEYLQCLDTESEAAIAKASDEQKDDMRRILQQKHLAAMSQRDELSARYTEQLRIFTAKEKDKKGF